MPLFGARALVGVVHLGPLPGSPGWSRNLGAVIAAATRDARAYLEGGMDALLVENFGDVPFVKGAVAAATVAAMTRVVAVVTEVAGSAPVGVNVLRNDAHAALAIAVATGARFVRVNVHTGSMFTDQGLIEGDAAATLRLRASLGADIKILADVFVKHATPPPGATLAITAKDCVDRGLADGLIVTGHATGSAPLMDDLRLVRAAAAGVPILAGSGVTPANVASVLAIASGAIVGTSLKEHGDIRRPVDRDRVAALVAAAS